MRVEHEPALLPLLPGPARQFGEIVQQIRLRRTHVDRDHHVQVARLGPDRPAQRLDARQILRPHPLLVADLDRLEEVWLRMTVLNAPPSPFGFGPAQAILHEVAHILLGLIGAQAEDRPQAGGFAKVHELEDAEAVRGVGIEEAHVGFAPVARANHPFPLVMLGAGGIAVDHRAIVAHRRHAHPQHGLGHLAPHRQPLVAPPLARLQEGVIDRDRPRRLERQRETPASRRSRRREGERQALIFLRPRGQLQRLLGQHPAVFAAQRRINLLRGAAPESQLAFVGLAPRQVDPLTKEPGVVDTQFAGSGLKPDLLRLPAREHSLAHQRKSARGASAPDLEHNGG